MAPWAAEIGLDLVEDQTCSLLPAIYRTLVRKVATYLCDLVAWGLMVGKEIVQAGILIESDGTKEVAIAWSSEGSRA